MFIGSNYERHGKFGKWAGFQEKFNNRFNNREHSWDVSGKANEIREYLYNRTEGDSFTRTDRSHLQERFGHSNFGQFRMSFLSLIKRQSNE